jgi:hypothetical protein
MDSTGSNSSAAVRDLPAQASLVVGLATHDNAATIAVVARAVRQGLERLSPAVAPCVVITDTGSSDRTPDQARQILDGVGEIIERPFEAPPGDPLKQPYHGMPGRAEAIRAVLTVARDREATACAFLDAGLTDCPPEWIPLLAEPIVAQGFDLVSAFYTRHPIEGAITKSIVAPAFRALYGVRLRQPAASEFACSLRLARHALELPFWDAEAADVGVDLRVGSAAAIGGFRVCEALLGVRSASTRPGAPDLSVAIQQVVGALFLDLESHAGIWQRTRGSTPVPAFGHPSAAELESPSVDLDRLIEAFRLGYDALRDLWAWVVPPRTILSLKRLAAASSSDFRLDDDLWVHTIYDFALAHRQRTMPREHLLGAMTPLYLGWLASYLREVGHLTPDEADRRLDRLGETFEAQKPYLISRWRWPERFRA